MRACEHCGLSIGDTATFCAVCGARAEPVASTDQTPAPEAPALQTATTPRRRRAASPQMLEAGRLEKTDPARSATLYREAILGLLESAVDPLDDEGARRDLLLIFDRLSLVLKREGLPGEALEEIDSAASLGLLDCRDRGVKGHREALRKRGESLRRTLRAEAG